MTAVPAYVATDTYGIRWYIICCHRCPHLTGVQRLSKPIQVGLDFGSAS